MKTSLLLLAPLALLILGCQGGKKSSSPTVADEVGATTPIVSAMPESAQAAIDGTQTLTLADGVKVTWINDNLENHPNPPSLFPDASEELIRELGLENGMESTVSTFLVETDGIRVLFDTGIGREGSQLIARMQALGVSPEDLQYLYLTHYHGDHIGGMLTGGTITFPNAQVYAPRVEHEAWMAMTADKNALQVKTFEAYADRLHLFEFGDELPGGIVPIAAVGHTPGHTAFRVGRHLLIIGDLMHGAALQIPHPEICAKYDMDPAAAVEARQRILNYARTEGLVMAGMHLPAPAFIQSLDSE